jgi:hypothetical protein
MLVFVGGEEVEGDGIGEGERLRVGVCKDGLGEGESLATGVEVGSTSDSSSWLNRKVPSSMPTLMSVTAMLLRSCPRPAACPVSEGICSLIAFPRFH